MAKKPRTDPYAKPKESAVPAGPARDPAALKVLARLRRAERLRQPHEGMMQECYDYALPTKQGIFGQAAGEDRMVKIFDETAVVGAQEFASRIQAGLMPPFARWAALVAGGEVPADQKDEVTQALEGATEYLFDLIQESNLSDEVGEALLDVAVGTAFLEIEEGDATRPFVAKALPLSGMWIDTGPDDRIDTFIRKHRMRTSHIRLKWPRAQIPASLDRIYTEAIEGRDDPECCIIECVRRDYAQPNEERWVRELVHEADQSLLMTESMVGEGSCPIIGFRWSKMAGEVWGRGPLVLAMPAIKTVNLTMELIFENAELAIAGIWTAEDDGVINVSTIQLVPGTVIPVAAGSAGLKAQGPAGNFDVSQLVLNEFRQAIKKALFNDSLDTPGKTPRTATEIAERQADLARQIGASFARLMNELVKPAVARLVYLMRRRRMIELPGKIHKIHSTSPLARSQQMQDVSNFSQYGQLVQQMFGPQVANLVLNHEEAAPWLASKMDVPKKLVRSATDQQALVAKMQGMQDSPDPNSGSAPLPAPGGP